MRKPPNRCLRAAGTKPSGAAMINRGSGAAAASVLATAAVLAAAVAFSGCDRAGPDAAAEGEAVAAGGAATEITGAGIGAAAPKAPARKPGQAVLVEGSAPVKGLPGFGRNAIPGLAGAYEVGGADGATVRVGVWYTKEPLVLPRGLLEPGCRVTPAGYATQVSERGMDGSTLWFMAAKDYTLIAAIPSGLADPCAFAAGLMDRFAFFKGYASRPEDVSFPASIELGE